MNLKTVSGSAVELSEVAFGREFNEALVHQVVTAYLAGGRQGTRAQNRVQTFLAVVKPFRQKVLVVLVRVLFVALSGLVVVKLLLLVHKIGLKK